MSERPFFSIITVSYNEEDTIKNTIESILKQSCDDFELIIKDACSYDSTIQLVPKNEKIKIKVSPDKGIYYGMNEAIELANGRYLLFLNCGDELHNETVLQKVKDEIIQKSLNAQIVYGNYFNGGVFCKQKEQITPFYLYRTPLNHQSVFFSKEVFENGEKYNIDFLIYADYEFTLRMFKKGKSFFYVNYPISDYLGGGISESDEGIRIAKKEEKRIHKKFYSVNERIKYELILVFSLRKIRVLLAKSKYKIVRTIYQNLVNLINRN